MRRVDEKGWGHTLRCGQEAEGLEAARIKDDIVDVGGQLWGGKDVESVLCALGAVLDGHGVEEDWSDEAAKGRVDRAQLEEVEGMGEVEDEGVDELEGKIVHGGGTRRREREK